MTAMFLVAMAAPSQGAPSAWVQLLPFALVLAIFYFIILMPMKRRQQKVATFLEGLKEGDKVVTSGGIYGTITKVGDQALLFQATCFQLLIDEGDHNDQEDAKPHYRCNHR